MKKRRERPEKLSAEVVEFVNDVDEALLDLKRLRGWVEVIDQKATAHGGRGAFSGWVATSFRCRGSVDEARDALDSLEWILEDTKTKTTAKGRAKARKSVKAMKQKAEQLGLAERWQRAQGG